LPWSNFVFFFSLEILNRWFVKLKLIALVFVITIGVNVGGDGRDGLILVYVDQML
jgi:hypothetical protein